MSLLQNSLACRSTGAACVSPHRDRGAVLIMSLLLLVVLVGLALTQTRETRVELQAAGHLEAAAQARAIALAAARTLLADPDQAPVEAVEVGGGAYWIIRPNLEDDRTQDFGVVVESSKVNLNAANEQTLLKLPNMTEALAGAIIEWRDRNQTVNTALGVESDHYLMLTDAYRAKDDDLETIEELLLLRGFTALELYGEDANRNGVLDPNEDDGDASSPPDNADGALDHGLLPLVTVYSREPQDDQQSDAETGQQRIDVNDRNHRATESALERAFIPALGEERADDVADDITDRRPIRNEIDLFYKSRTTIEEFDQIIGFMKVGQSNRRRSAGVNINTAPARVLATLPNMTEDLAQALVQYRGTVVSETSTGLDGPTSPSSMAWVTQVLERDQAMAIADHLTTSDQQRSADIVAAAPGGRAFERFRLVFDVSETPARVLLWQRLTHLGWPLDQTLLTELQSGAAVRDLTQSTQGGASGGIGGGIGAGTGGVN